MIVQLRRKERWILTVNIDVRSRTPIYEQIITEIKRMIALGIVSADEKCPSVRQLSAELGINPNTLQKAYTELEREGIIYTVSGKGCFIASNTEIFEKQHKAKILTELEKKLCEAKESMISKEEVYNLVKEIYEGGDSI